MNIKISMFLDFSNKSEDKELKAILKDIKSGIYRNKVEEIRQWMKQGNKETADKLKKKLPAFTVTGTFEKRNAQSIINYSQLLILDIDNQTDEQLKKVINLARLVHFTYTYFKSPSGKGLKIIVKVDSKKEHHKLAYKQVAEHYEKALETEIDTSGSDISRLCFMSYDNEMYLNQNADVFIVNIQEQELTNQDKHHEHTSDNIESYLQEIEGKGIDITGNYETWRNLGFALSDEYGEAGREYFHRISKFHPKYHEKQCDDQFTKCLNAKGTGVTISTFYHHANQYVNLHHHQQNQPHEEEEKVVYNAVELMEIDDSAQRYLIDPIFPQRGTAVLAGKPDTGKSQLARNLCILVAVGADKFLNFDLTLRHQRAIYVATEDSKEATQFLLKKQFDGFDFKATENLKFIFADTLEQDEILKTIKEEVSKKPVDLVVVDSFGDIFKGNDSNNNMAMRNTVKIFDKVAKQHDFLILFVHHINKGAYRQAPGQEHIQGGAGLVQKVRLAIQLTEGEGNTRYFTVVKGNYCPKEYKDISLELEFSEDSFIFTNTGRTIPTDELGKKEETGNKEEKYDELKEIAVQIFSDHDLLKYGRIVQIYCETTNKSAPTAKRKIKLMEELEMISKTNGVYRLNTEKEATTTQPANELPF